MTTPYFTLHGVAIPLRLDDRFISPDLEQALAYYPQFSRQSPVALSQQEYLLAILKEIDRVQPNEHTGDRTLQHFIQHVGLIWMVEFLGIDLSEAERAVLSSATLADRLRAALDQA